MAEVTKGRVSLASAIPTICQITGIHGEVDIAAGDACYIKSNGKIALSTGAAANVAANVIGWAPKDYPLNGAETPVLYWNVHLSYSNSIVPGKSYFLSGTVAGGIADAASTGGSVPTAYGLTKGRIIALQTIIR